MENFGEVADNIHDKTQMPKEAKKVKKRTLNQKLRDASLLYGDGSTPKRPKSLKTKTPKGGVSVSEETEMGQAPQAEMAKNLKKPLPAVPKKTTMGTKFSPNVSFEDILNDEAVANATAESTTESGRDASTAAAAAVEHAADDVVEEININANAEVEDSTAGSSSSSDEDDDAALASESEDDEEAAIEDGGRTLAGVGNPSAVAVASQEPPAPTGGHRRASAPVSSLCDDSGFARMLEGIEGPAGWRGLFKDGNPFCGEFAAADSDEAAKKTAAAFDVLSKLVGRLQTENSQFRDRLVAAEGDKKSLLAAASSSATAGGAAAAVKREEEWRKGFKFTGKFDAGAKENIEEFLRELDFALKKAQVFNERQRLHTLLDSLGKITSTDYVLKSEELQRDKGLSLNYEQSCAYLRRRWPRLETRSEILKKFKTFKMQNGQDMRAFLIELENLLELMKLHSLERSVFDVVDALKDKCDPAVVAKVLAVEGSEERDEDLTWWKEHLIKFRGEATTGGNLNAMGDKSKTKGDKGKGRFKNGTRKGKYGSVPRPKMEKVQDALDDGDKLVYRLYQGDAKLKKLWKERMELRAAGGDPTTRPELFAQDKYFARYNESGKVKPGYPVPVCVTCGLTWHTAGTHQDRKKSE